MVRCPGQFSMLDWAQTGWEHLKEKRNVHQASALILERAGMRDLCASSNGLTVGEAAALGYIHTPTQVYRRGIKSNSGVISQVYFICQWSWSLHNTIQRLKPVCVMVVWKLALGYRRDYSVYAQRTVYRALSHHIHMSSPVFLSLTHLVYILPRQLSTLRDLPTSSSLAARIVQTASEQEFEPWHFSSSGGRRKFPQSCEAQCWGYDGF